MNSVVKPSSRKRRRPDVVEVRPDRKAEILLAAEKLFAQNGYHAVTIRQIAEEAKVPLALVGYYYGQKHELFEAIFVHWNHTIEERMNALQAAQRVPLDAQTLHRIITAFVNPVLRMRASPEGEYYALLIARELSFTTDVTDRILRTYFDPMANAFIEALNQVHPNTSRGQIAWCYQFALGALIHHMSDVRVKRLSQNQSAPGDPDAHAMLINFIVGGIRAALAPADQASLPSTPRKTTRRSP